jgi:hypothetical protein
MPTFELGLATAAIGSAAPYATLHTGANRRGFIREFGVFAGTAVSCFVGIGTPANTPVATTSTLLLAKDTADAAATVNLDTAWSTTPTVPTNFLRALVLGAAVGAGVINKVALDERYTLAKSSWCVFWNNGAATSAPLTVYAEVDE